jgi:hypothetical protein
MNALLSTRFLTAWLCVSPCRYAKSERLRSLVNLVVVGGVIDPEDTGDREERDECVKMHGLIKEYKLQVCVCVCVFWGRGSVTLGECDCNMQLCRGCLLVNVVSSS